MGVNLKQIMGPKSYTEILDHLVLKKPLYTDKPLTAEEAYRKERERIKRLKYIHERNREI